MIGLDEAARLFLEQKLPGDLEAGMRLIERIDQRAMGLAGQDQIVFQAVAAGGTQGWYPAVIQALRVQDAASAGTLPASQAAGAPRCGVAKNSTRSTEQRPSLLKQSAIYRRVMSPPWLWAMIATWEKARHSVSILARSHSATWLTGMPSPNALVG